jgi:cell division topological specificity factor
MNPFNLFRRSSSAPIARERLQILLAHERDARDQPDLLGVLREEILAAISRHVSFDPDKVQITMDRGKNVSTLAVDIEIPHSRRAAAGIAPIRRLAFEREAVAARSQWTNGLI